MWRLALLTLLACSARTPIDPPSAPSLTLLLRDDKGIAWWRDGTRTQIPGTEHADTFAWDAERREILITEGTKLRAISPAGDRTLLEVDGTLRFPAIAQDGRIVVSFLANGDAQDNWQLLELPDKRLGPGYLPTFCTDGTMYFERHDGGPNIWTWAAGASEPAFVVRPGHTARCVDHRVLITQKTLVALDRTTGAITPMTAHYDRFASMDGATLVVTRVERRELVVIDLATKRERVIATGDVQALIVR